ncbi:hypothetical protein BZG36_01603 [Bifiguratus adelaidae]|uniref:Ribosomal RNA-processing protein 8 n=1 Tax=Bifiguratus adelaidae TaxID=1938954 RepID=A0A261Y4E0_9FUNG|nr:hypothetical protein BZG36_01603 [Bifiguratus adelaidae]
MSGRESSESEQDYTYLRCLDDNIRFEKVLRFLRQFRETVDFLECRASPDLSQYDIQYKGCIIEVTHFPKATNVRIADDDRAISLRTKSGSPKRLAEFLAESTRWSPFYKKHQVHVATCQQGHPKWQVNADCHYPDIEIMPPEYENIINSIPRLGFLHSVARMESVPLFRIDITNRYLSEPSLSILLDTLPGDSITVFEGLYRRDSATEDQLIYINAWLNQWLKPGSVVILLKEKGDLPPNCSAMYSINSKVDRIFALPSRERADHFVKRDSGAKSGVKRKKSPATEESGHSKRICPDSALPTPGVTPPPTRLQPPVTTERPDAQSNTLAQENNSLWRRLWTYLFPAKPIADKQPEPLQITSGYPTKTMTPESIIARELARRMRQGESFETAIANAMATGIEGVNKAFLMESLGNIATPEALSGQVDEKPKPLRGRAKITQSKAEPEQGIAKLNVDTWNLGHVVTEEIKDNASQGKRDKSQGQGQKVTRNSTAGSKGSSDAVADPTKKNKKRKREDKEEGAEVHANTANLKKHIALKPTPQPQKDHHIRRIEESIRKAAAQPKKKVKDRKKNKQNSDLSTANVSEATTKELKQPAPSMMNTSANATSKKNSINAQKLQKLLAKQKQKGASNADKSQAKAGNPIQEQQKALQPTSAVAAEKLTPMQQQMKKKLSGARFRWLNEQLYTTSGEESFKLFQDKPEMFDEYHAGFRSQVESWPTNPVDVLIEELREVPAGTTIVDLGCGDAKIGEVLDGYKANKKVKQGIKVLSFDLVAKNDRVMACDIAHLPLPNESVDIAVFCLSLMGANYTDFLREALRVLKKGGQLKIAEVQSRFTSLDTFISILEQLGFEFVSQDTSNKMFVMMEFIKGEAESIDASVRQLDAPESPKSKKKAKRNRKMLADMDRKQLEATARDALKPCFSKVSFVCPNKQVYKPRPTRTQQLTKPLKVKEIDLPQEFLSRKEKESVAAKILKERKEERRRKRRRSVSSSSSGSGSSFSGSDSESSVSSSSSRSSRSAPSRSWSRSASRSSRSSSRSISSSQTVIVDCLQRPNEVLGDPALHVVDPCLVRCQVTPSVHLDDDLFLAPAPSRKRAHEPLEPQERTAISAIAVPFTEGHHPARARAHVHVPPSHPDYVLRLCVKDLAHLSIMANADVTRRVRPPAMLGTLAAHQRDIPAVPILARDHLLVDEYEVA